MIIETDVEYLMPIGHQYYLRAANAQTLDKCLYWLDRYYDVNRRLVLKKYKEQNKQKRNWSLAQTRCKRAMKGKIKC